MHDGNEDVKMDVWLCHYTSTNKLLIENANN